MQAKIERVKELLRERGIDGAIVSSPENFHYVAGFSAHQHTVSRQPGMAFAVMQAAAWGGCCLATMDFEATAFKERNVPFTIKKYDTWVGVKRWQELTGEAVPIDNADRMGSFDVLLESVLELGLANRAIGVELSYLPVDYYQKLRANLPEARFVDISGLFVYARSVKTPEEISCFRTLCGVVDKALIDVAANVEIGVSERDLSELFRVSVTKTGLCLPSAWSMFSAGSNGARLGLPGERRIARGDVVKFDGGVNAEFDFYTTDTSRAWVMEGAEPLLYKLKDRLYEAQRKMVAAAKPGIPICEIYKAGYSHVSEMFPAYRRGHMGHSISMGPATAEAPFITAGETRLLEPGMVLAIEAPCYISDVGGFNIEDMVLITEEGSEILTSKAPHYL